MNIIKSIRKIAARVARLFWKRYRWVIDDEKELRKAKVAVPRVGMVYGDVRLRQSPRRGDTLLVTRYEDEENKKWRLEGRVVEVVIHPNGVTVKLKLMHAKDLS